MDFYKILYLFSGCFLLGFLIATFWHVLEKRFDIKKIKSQARHFIQEAQDKADSLLEDTKANVYQDQEQALNKFEKSIKIKSEKIKTLQENLDKIKHKLHLKNKQKLKFFEQTNQQIQTIQNNKTQNLKKEELQRQELQQILKHKTQKLITHLNINTQKLKEQVQTDVEQAWRNTIQAGLDIQKDYYQTNLQKLAYFYIHTALNRFHQKSCSKRGLKSIIFKSHKELQNVCGPDNILLQDIEKECGVDILIHPETYTASVFGIDPVRRELGRITLKKLAKKTHINKQLIIKTTKLAKKHLFEIIRQDGLDICKKLHLTNVAPEVKNMMGALMYRYSFAQNQYFHCEEVSWLCGILNAEISLPFKLGQRSGLFHDIGKAMDHSIEGSHAIIGADFLSKHQEQKDILHAVRAHHHDEAPSTGLAYLVIAADAISGSRPGARRFTENSYNQKIETLEKILDSFQDIEDAYIMNAGREMRVVVNNKKISDKQALDLSKQLARKVEKECSYPGFIKIVVVRHSESVAIA